MSLSCDFGDDFDGCDWYWEYPQDEAPLATKRSRKCKSCGTKISVGNVARKIRRYAPTEDGNERDLANYYFCETCGDLSDSLREVDFCYSLDESLASQIKEYRAGEKAWNQRHKGTP